MSQEEKMHVLGVMKPLSARPYGEKKAIDAAIAASVAAAASEVADECPLRRTRRMFPAKESLPPFRPIDAAVDGIWEHDSKAGATSSTDAGPCRLIPDEMRDKMLLQQKATAMRKAVRARYAPKRADEHSREPDF